MATKHHREKHGDPDLQEPVEIGPEIFWVGSELKEDTFQCHVYLIRHGRDSVLLDPGSRLTWPATREKLKKLIDLEDIRYLVCHHQDPDITACIGLLEHEAPRADREIVCHWRTQTLLKHMDWPYTYYLVNEHNWQLILPGGRKLQFVFIPYLHFPGSICTIDEQSGILFSSDLFGAFTEEFRLFAKDESYMEGLRPFHEHYMPSREILLFGLEELARHRIRMIAPQHGSIIPSHLIDPIISAMKKMECGLYLLPIYQNSIHDLSRLNRLYRTLLRNLSSRVRFRESLEQLWNFLTAITSVKGTWVITWDDGERCVLYAAPGGLDPHSFGTQVKDLRYYPPFDRIFQSVDPVSLPEGIKIPGIPSKIETPVTAIPLREREGALQGIWLLDRTWPPGKKIPFLEELKDSLTMLVQRERAYLELAQERDEYYRKATLDMLTGLFNRHYLAIEGPREVHKAIRYGHPLSVVMIDIDHFKRVNDTYGHPVGDRVLKEIARIIRHQIREVDMPVRYGGEELLILISHTDLTGAVSVAERIRNRIASHRFQADNQSFSVTISLGVATFHPGDTLDSLIKRADQSLYRAKAAGRNRTLTEERA